MAEREVVDLAESELAQLRALGAATSGIKKWITVPITGVVIGLWLYGASQDLDGDRVSSLLWLSAFFLGFVIWFQFFAGAYRKDIRIGKKEILVGPIEAKSETSDFHMLRVGGEWTTVDVTTYTRLDEGNSVRIERTLGSGLCLSCQKI